MLQSPYMQTLIPAMRNYYETPHYIFVHGWIPCTEIRYTPRHCEHVYIEGWRDAGEAAWDKARWMNGMDAAYNGAIETGKTIVCGHWHCSYGHSQYEEKGGQFDNNPDFTPYYGNGIIALDACTSFSGSVNCIVIDD